MKGFSGARFKKFSTKAEALEFINSASDPYYSKSNCVSTHIEESKKRIDVIEINSTTTASTSKKRKLEVISNVKEIHDFDSDFNFDDTDNDDRIKDQIKNTVDNKIPFSFGSGFAKFFRSNF